MNELIKVNFDKEQPTVSARDLHEQLNIGKRFSAWFETNSKETKRINVHILYKELKKQQSLSVHTWMKLFLKWKKLKKRK